MSGFDVLTTPLISLAGLDERGLCSLHHASLEASLGLHSRLVTCTGLGETCVGSDERECARECASM